MRLVLGLFVLCLAAPASAQSAFYAACLASTEGELPVGVAQQICGCTEASALDAGETAASLDRYQAFLAALDPGASGQVDAGAPPEWAVATSANLMGGMSGCLTTLNRELASAPVGDEPSPRVGPAPATGPARPAALPRGLRTGDGSGPVRAVQQGNGAAVRILG